MCEWLRPDPDDGIATKSAFPVLDLFSRDRKMGSINYSLFTPGTESGVHFMTWGISDIYIFKALLLGNLIGSFQSLDGRGRQMGQFILRKEAIEVEGSILSQILLNPDTHLPDILRIIIQCWDHEVNDFKMPSIRSDYSKGMEHWLQF
jgi:hypothetical protein